jgi:hypothetical protein
MNEKIKQQEIEISWAFYNGDITESEYIEAKKQIMQLQTLKQKDSENIL